MSKRLYDVPEGMSRAFYKEITTDCLDVIASPYAALLRATFEEGPKSFGNPNPNSYECPDTYFQDAQAYALVSKNSALDSPYDLQSEAIDSFFENESHCRGINDEYRKAFDNGFRVGNGPPDWIMGVKANIRNLIGDKPDLTLKPNESFYGPGQTTTHKGRSVNLFHKIVLGHECTSGCLKIAEWLFRGSRVGFTPTLTTRSKFGTVPKSAKTLRPICTEPGYNLNCQKFLGSRLRNCLTKAAYNLDSQHELHKICAREASVTETHATIDLKAASDRISFEVVKLLLPDQWFSFLNQARSHNTMINGNEVKLQKFSSMGNGFTFELETIIFLGVLMSLPHNRFLSRDIPWRSKRAYYPGGIIGDISVFGDDIICRSEDAAMAIERLKFLGFEINTDKSFTEGSFRESCGGDYWKGVDVRPTYLKGPSSDGNPQDWYNLANAIYKISMRLYGRPPRETRFAKAFSKVVKNCPPDFVEFGPITELGLGDTDGYPYFLSDTPTIHKANNNQMSFVYACMPIPYLEEAYGTDDEIIAYAILGGSSEGSPIRGTIKKIRKARYYLML